LLSIIINETGSKLVTDENGNKSIINLKDFDINNVKMLRLPMLDSMYISLQKLYNLGFIDMNCGVSISGLLANTVQKISLESIKMILSGYFYGCNVLDLITIAAFDFKKFPTEPKPEWKKGGRYYDNIDNINGGYEPPWDLQMESYGVYG